MGEDELAPDWYDTGASKSKKRKLISSTKDLEKRKKAATPADAEDETVGNVPLKRLANFGYPDLDILICLC